MGQRSFLAKLVNRNEQYNIFRNEEPLVISGYNNPKKFTGLIETLNVIAEKYGYPIIVSPYYPSTQKMLEEKKVTVNPLTQFYPPLALQIIMH